MVRFDPSLHLPTSDELPDSDDTPVDNEDQNFIPNFLLFLLEFFWANRNDWYFGVDMGIYHTTRENPRIPIIPDGFLSLGVQRRKQGKSRKSYVVWEEAGIVPILVLEIVSLTPGNEYDEKLAIYAKLGILYYVIYNPEYWQRDRHQPLEIYRLVDGVYQLEMGEPIWLPEIGLGIGRSQYHSGTVEREILFWYNENGEQLQSPEMLLIQERQRAEQERQRAEQIQKAAISQLLSMGLSREKVASALGLSLVEVNKIVPE
jgi:Uma2 family endonuclease